MGQQSQTVRTWEGGGKRGIHYWCQGCRSLHGVVIDGPGAWGFNGDYEKPTFTPSVLTTGNRYEIDEAGEADTSKPVRDGEGALVKLVCHTFITDGMVHFLGDCGHELAGQTLPLPPLPDWLKDE
jgi:hypothetical protein